MEELTSHNTNNAQKNRRDNEKKLKLAWTNHIKWNSEQGEVRTEILDSWGRSRKYGVNPDSMVASAICSTQNQKKRMEKNQGLLNLIRPFMDDLYDILRGTDSIIAFADSEGILLELFGDSEIALNAANANFIVGADMREKFSGTNAIGTALVTGRPLQVVGSEHFCVAWHTSNCSSAPIRDPQSNQIIGVLTVVGYLKTAHPHSLALVKTAADTVSKLIEQKGLKYERYIIDQFFEAALNSVSDGILIVNSEGQVIQYNKKASQLLNIRADRNKNFFIKDIESLKSLSINIHEIVEQNRVISCKPRSEQNRNRENLLLSSQKIEVDGGHIGTTIIIKSKDNKRPINTHPKYHFSSLHGQDDELIKLKHYASKAAKTDKSIVVVGESGTGKEIFAQAIHNESYRKNEVFLAVNCASIPHELIASELFGYTEGAFTNASRGGKKGKFEAANGGTLFLDEIGDMPLELQATLLRVLEEKEITPLGSNQSKKVDVRIIAATNQNLRKLVNEKKFRLDLFYRLNSITLSIPALRNRKQDIAILMKQFLPSREFEPQVFSVFHKYDWPGNIRELKNVLEQMDLFSDHQIISCDVLPEYIKEAIGTDEIPHNIYKAAAKETKRESLIMSLRAAKNIKEAAEQLGVSSSTVYRWSEEEDVIVKEFLGKDLKK